jgi:hypothetical protein
VHVGHNDHKALSDLIAAGDASLFGVVFDATQLRRHSELRDQAIEHNLDVVLNPKSQESALVGGYKDAFAQLPWGRDRPHTHADFEATSGRRIAAELAHFALDNGFTQIMAPSHLLRSAQDSWLSLDVQTCQRLREQLDRKGGANIPIVYPLAIPYATFRDGRERDFLIRQLAASGASAIWLQIDRTGSAGSPTMVRNYINAAAAMQEVGIPLVADHIGGLIGLSLLAFGAVGGISHGVTLGERFDTSHLRKPKTGKGFLPSHRVYIRPLDLMLERRQAKQIFEAVPRAKATFGCNDTKCCPRGLRDMLEHPARHFMYQRMKDVGALSAIPEHLRAGVFLEDMVRPASDMAVRAAALDYNDEALNSKLHKHRKRLDQLRLALSDYNDARPGIAFALPPQRRAVRESTR